MSMIAEALEVSELDLRLAMGSDNRPRAWTREEDELLFREYPTGDTAALARRLRRSAQAVKNRTASLGIKKSALWQLRQARLRAESRKSRRSEAETIRNAVSFRENNTQTKGEQP